MTKQGASDMIDNAGNLHFINMTTEDTKTFLKNLVSATNALSATASLNFPSTTTGLSADLTIAVVGAVTGQTVKLGVPIAAVNANTSYSAFVSAADVVTVRFNNYSAGTVDPAAGTFKVVVE